MGIDDCVSDWRFVKTGVAFCAKPFSRVNCVDWLSQVLLVSLVGKFELVRGLSILCLANVLSIVLLLTVLGYSLSLIALVMHLFELTSR